ASDAGSTPAASIAEAAGGAGPDSWPAPAPPTRRPVAQRSEQRSYEPSVVGSSPTGPISGTGPHRSSSGRAQPRGRFPLTASEAYSSRIKRRDDTGVAHSCSGGRLRLAPPVAYRRQARGPSDNGQHAALARRRWEFESPGLHRNRLTR